MTDGNVKVAFKREELYELVWETPLTQLARQFGISDVGLAKICKKLRVPRPPVGYWAKVKHGKKVARPALTKIGPGEPAEYVHIPDPDGLGSNEMKGRFKDTPQLTRPVIVPDRLESPHPLVKQTIAILKEMKPDEYGMLHPRKEGCLNLRIGPPSVHRALIILDAVLKEFGSLGYAISINKGEKPRTCVEIAGDKIPFMLIEDAKRLDHVLTKKEESDKKASHYWYAPKYDFSPSSRLALILDTWSARGLRKRWSDSPRKRLEEQLGDFVNGAVLVAYVMKEDRLRYEEERRKQEEERKAREEADRQEAAEKARRRDLETEAAQWAKSQKIRAYIRAVESFLAQEWVPEEVRKEREPWIAWAKAHAERIDPLRELVVTRYSGS